MHNYKCNCKKCGTLLTKETRLKISVQNFVPDTQCSGELDKTLNQFSLCNACYEEYAKVTDNFLGEIK